MIPVKSGTHTVTVFTRLVSDIALIGCYLASGDDRLANCGAVNRMSYVLTVCTNIVTMALIWYFTW